MTRADIVNAVKAIRAESELCLAVDLAIAHLMVAKLLRPVAKGPEERATGAHDYSAAGTEQTAPTFTDADWNVRAAHRPSDFTAEGWTLAVYGAHLDGCKAGPSASKRHSACDCGLSQAIYRLNARAEQTAPAEPPECRDSCTATFSGHWRDWHRGHGCNLDPDVTREAADGRSSAPAPQDPTTKEHEDASTRRDTSDD